MKNTNKIKIVYYDGNGQHESKPCDSISLVQINMTIPAGNTLPTLTYSLWNGTQEDGNGEYITVPFVHEIIPAKTEK